MTAARFIIVIIFQPHDSDGELHACKDDSICQPKHEHGQDTLLGMADQVSHVRDIEPQQHADKDCRDCETDQHVHDVESN